MAPCWRREGPHLLRHGYHPALELLSTLGCIHGQERHRETSTRSCAEVLVEGVRQTQLLEALLELCEQGVLGGVVRPTGEDEEVGPSWARCCGRGCGPLLLQGLDALVHGVLVSQLFYKVPMFAYVLLERPEFLEGGGFEIL